jgi:hypothetical protein
MAKGELWEKGDAVRRELIGEAAIGRMSQGVYDDPIMERFATTRARPCSPRCGRGRAWT